MVNETLFNTSSIDMGTFGGAVLGGGLAAIGIILIIIAIALFAAVYIYHAIAWQRIAKNLKYKRSWLAWIPFASSAMRLQLGKKFHWSFVFLYLIPILGWIAIWILLLISHWSVFEKLNYPGWLSLLQLIDLVASGIGTIANLIVVGFVAWKKQPKVKN